MHIMKYRSKMLTEELLGLNTRKICVVLAATLLICSLSGSAILQIMAQQEEYLFTIHLIVPALGPGPERDRALVIQDALKQIDVNVALEFIEMSQFYARAWSEETFDKTWDEGGWDSDITGFGGTPIDLLWWPPCFLARNMPPTGWNYFGWNNALADYYLTQGGQTFSEEGRASWYAKWVQEFMNDPPADILYYPEHALVHTTDFNPLNGIPEDVQGLFEQLMLLNEMNWTMQQGDTVKIAQVEEPINFNPALIAGIPDDAVTFWQFDGLTKLAVTGEGRLTIVPSLAESWEFTDENRTIIWHLRDDVYWHDGVKFTANDVKFTFDAIKNPETAASSSSFYLDLASTEVLDNYTVAMHFSVPNAMVLTMAYENSGAILPEHVLKDYEPSGWRTNFFNTDPLSGPYVGTGPYKMVEWARGQYIKYEANQDYWMGPPPIKYIYLVFIGEPASALAAIQNHEVNYLLKELTDPVLTDVQALQGSSGINVEFYAGTRIPWISFNLNHPILSNRYVRLAICHAIPVQQIIDTVMNGLAVPAKGPISPSTRFYPADVQPYTYDLVLARQYLAEAGYTLPVQTELSPWIVYGIPVVSAVGGVVLGAVFSYFMLRRRTKP